MTIKKRLAISNVIMIMLPIVVTALVGLACSVFIYIAVYSSSSFGFTNNEDFSDLCQAIVSEVEEATGDEPESMLRDLNGIYSLMCTKTMRMVVYRNGQTVFADGAQADCDASLVSAVTIIGKNALVSGDTRFLFRRVYEDGGDEYELLIFSNRRATQFRRIEVAAIIMSFIIGLSIIISSFFTDKFLIHFVFKRIEDPLDQLVFGVNEISKGNLDYRLPYSRDDEFSPVCGAFNGMAVRLKKSVEQTNLEEQNRRELLLDISHDLRSPLTSIQAYVEGLLDGVAVTPAMQKKYLETIKRKTTDIDHMVSELFAYSKLDMDESLRRLEPMELSSSLREIVTMCRDDFGDGSLYVVFERCDKVNVLANRELLVRVICNLLENSSKYRKGETCTVMLSVVQHGESVTVSFSDDGKGVPQSTLDRLFEVFYRTDEARSNPGSGSGIGLAFVKKATEKMHGKVCASINERGGLTAELELPVSGYVN